MTQAKMMVAAAVAALTLGITGQTPAPIEQAPLAEHDILIVDNQPAPTGTQTEENADESAKMGKEEGTHTGTDQGATPENDTDKIDQAARRNPTTSNDGSSDRGIEQ